MISYRRYSSIFLLGLTLASRSVISNFSLSPNLRLLKGTHKVEPQLMLN